jgi:hypothetical protein
MLSTYEKAQMRGYAEATGREGGVRKGEHDEGSDEVESREEMFGNSG